MDDKTIITELSNMTLPDFIRNFNSMSLDERIELLKNPYLNELDEIIFSSLFLQVQNMKEVIELLDDKKIFHKVLTSPKILPLLSKYIVLFSSTLNILSQSLQTNYITENSYLL